MPLSKFAKLAAVVFAYFGLILLSIVVAYPYGMIVLVALGGILLLSIEVLGHRRAQKQDDSYSTNSR